MRARLRGKRWDISVAHWAHGKSWQSASRSLRSSRLECGGHRRLTWYTADRVILGRHVMSKVAAG